MLGKKTMAKYKKDKEDREALIKKFSEAENLLYISPNGASRKPSKEESDKLHQARDKALADLRKKQIEEDRNNIRQEFSKAEDLLYSTPKGADRVPTQKEIQKLRRARNKALINMKKENHMYGFEKKVLYNCRKQYADSRPRVGGRFLPNAEPKVKVPNYRLYQKGSTQAIDPRLPIYGDSETAHVVINDHVVPVEVREATRGRPTKTFRAQFFQPPHPVVASNKKQRPVEPEVSVDELVKSFVRDTKKPKISPPVTAIRPQLPPIDFDFLDAPFNNALSQQGYNPFYLRQHEMFAHHDAPTNSVASTPEDNTHDYFADDYYYATIHNASPLKRTRGW